jgi:hypothetical protein
VNRGTTVAFLGSDIFREAKRGVSNPGRRSVLVSAAGLAGGLVFPAIIGRAQAASGAALVIGNSKYHWEASLPNVKRDVVDIAQRFQTLGLRTELLQELNRDALLRALDKLPAMANGANLAAFYFAGHGVVVGNNLDNFTTNLVPIDADLGSPAAAKALVPLPPVFPKLAGAANRLVLLDNCRNNPADAWRNRHLALMGAGGWDEHAVSNYEIPSNTLVLSSTAPGFAALDGPPGANSPFAGALLRQLAAPPVDLRALAGKVRRDVLIGTHGRQQVFSRTTYTSGFQIDGTPRQGPASPVAPGMIELPNAYAFARQSGLPMPDGLVAFRPSGSAGASKVGAYKSVTSGGRPALFIVLSMDDPQNVEMIGASYNSARGKSGWRYFRAAAKGDDVEYLSPDEKTRIVHHWNDANAGSISMMPLHQGGGGSGVHNFRFSRLDG